MNMQVVDICGRIMTEVEAANKKHGDWSDYDLEMMFSASFSEWCEFSFAYAADDVSGNHGMIREAIQAAACLVKFVAQLEARNGL